MIKLALTDLDETLIHFGLSRATDHALAAIEEAQAAGVHVAAVTGRIMDGLLDAFDGRESCCRTASVALSAPMPAPSATGASLVAAVLVTKGTSCPLTNAR